MVIYIDYIMFMLQCKWVRPEHRTGSLYGSSLQGVDETMQLSGNGLYLGYGAGLEGPQLEQCIETGQRQKLFYNSFIYRHL